MSVAALPLIATVGGTAFKVFGALKQGQAAQQAAQYNAAIAERNADISRQQAEAEALQIDREGRQRAGAIRAAAGASGITLEGSVLDVLADTVAQGELEKQNAMYVGNLRAMSYEEDAALELRSGKTARKASFYEAGAALLSGGAQGYTQYKGLKNGGNAPVT